MDNIDNKKGIDKISAEEFFSRIDSDRIKWLEPESKE